MRASCFTFSRRSNLHTVDPAASSPSSAPSMRSRNRACRIPAAVPPPSYSSCDARLAPSSETGALGSMILDRGVYVQQLSASSRTAACLPSRPPAEPARFGGDMVRGLTAVHARQVHGSALFRRRHGLLVARRCPPKPCPLCVACDDGHMMRMMSSTGGRGRERDGKTESQTPFPVH